MNEWNELKGKIQAWLDSLNPRERRPEGPFGDHYGYNSLTHDYPVFQHRGLQDSNRLDGADFAR